ncbi:hypothetical protein MAR_030869 [Mya arenaria]|uniref:Uncharacterized protein n=1 Tax=Mya arenaria TaxID=6604 RepID=A0ABY7F290_MYAAR|nr:uncharacterized protein LOC128206144 [Mya arenaria]WAR16275.1 hypothetical protein MAR_030869 [Mya arenaria]
MDASMVKGEIGKDIYRNSADEQFHNCSTKCEPPNWNPKACHYYCPNYVPKTKALLTTTLSTTSTTNGSISPVNNPDQSALIIVVAVVVILIVLLGFVAYYLINKSRQKRKIPKVGIEETGQNPTEEAFELTVIDETAQLMPGQPGPAQAATTSGDPNSGTPLIPVRDHEEERGSFIPEAVSDVDSEVDDINESQTDEALAREAQCRQDRLCADKERIKDDNAIRGKKNARRMFGETEPLPSDHSDDPGTANTAADDQQPVKNSTSFKDMSEATAVPETKIPEESQKSTNQSTSPRSQNSSNNATAPSSPATELVQSVLNEGQRRMHSNRSFVPSRNNVSLDHHDDGKQTENALNGQTLNQSVTH